MGITFGASSGEERAAVTPAATSQPSDATTVPGEAPTATPTAEAVDALSLQQQVGRLIVLRFHGMTAPSYVRKVLHNGWASGAILFKENVASPAQLRTLTAALEK